MIDVVVSDWYNHLKKELRSSGSSIEKVSRRSEYWRKSNLDIASKGAQDTSSIDVSEVKGTFLYESDLNVHGNTFQRISKENCKVLATF